MLPSLNKYKCLTNEIITNTIKINLKTEVKKAIISLKKVLCKNGKVLKYNFKMLRKGDCHMSPWRVFHKHDAATEKALSLSS